MLEGAYSDYSQGMHLPFREKNYSTTSTEPHMLVRWYKYIDQISWMQHIMMSTESTMEVITGMSIFTVTL